MHITCINKAFNNQCGWFGFYKRNLFNFTPDGKLNTCSQKKKKLLLYKLKLNLFFYCFLYNSEMENHVGEEGMKMVNHTENGHVDDAVTVEEMECEDGLIYKVTDNPPMHLTILFAFQVSGKLIHYTSD